MSVMAYGHRHTNSGYYMKHEMHHPQPTGNLKECVILCNCCAIIIVDSANVAAYIKETNEEGRMYTLRTLADKISGTFEAISIS